MTRTAAAAAALALLLGGGVLGSVATRLTDDEPQAAAGVSVPPLFVMATSEPSVRSEPDRTRLTFTGEVSVINPRAEPFDVTDIGGTLPGVTFTTAETTPRSIPARGQNLVTLMVVVESAFCEEGQKTTAFPAPVPLTLTTRTADGATAKDSLPLELAGTAWDGFVRERCARLTGADPLPS